MLGKALTTWTATTVCIKSSCCQHHAPQTPTLSLYPPVLEVLIIKTCDHHPFLPCWTICLHLLHEKEQQVTAAAARPIARPFIQQVSALVKSSDGTEEIIRCNSSKCFSVFGNESDVIRHNCSARKGSCSLILLFWSKNPVSFLEPWAGIWPLQPANTHGSVKNTCKDHHEGCSMGLVADRKHFAAAACKMDGAKGDLFHGFAL